MISPASSSLPGRFTAQWHAAVYLDGAATSRLGDDRTAQAAILPLGVDAGEGDRLVIGAGQVVRLLASLGRQPLEPAIGRDQAALPCEGVLEVALRGHRLNPGIDRLCGLALGPLRPEAPPQLKLLGRGIMLHLQKPADPGSRRNIVARRRNFICHHDTQPPRELGLGAVGSEAATHVRLLHADDRRSIIPIFSLDSLCASAWVECPISPLQAPFLTRAVSHSISQTGSTLGSKVTSGCSISPQTLD